MKPLNVLVKALREDARLTQDDLAALMGMPGASGRATVAFWESGQRQVPAKCLPKLAACLGYWPTRSPDLRREVIETALVLARLDGES
jgi:transcriptional regulator with XRE-family HTH domain